MALSKLRDDQLDVTNTGGQSSVSTTNGATITFSGNGSPSTPLSAEVSEIPQSKVVGLLSDLAGKYSASNPNNFQTLAQIQTLLTNLNRITTIFFVSQVWLDTGDNDQLGYTLGDLVWKDETGEENWVNLYQTAMFEDVYFDDQTNNLVIVPTGGGDAIEIPLGDLIPTFTGASNGQIQVTVNSSNEIEAMLLNGTAAAGSGVQLAHLSQALQTLINSISTKFVLPAGGATSQYLNGLGQLATMPTTLPNPQALSFTGGATGSYNGNAAMSVEIPTRSSLEAAPANMALTAEYLTGIDISTLAVASNTIANIVQTIWEKIRQVGNYILKGGKSPMTTTGTVTAYVLADTGVLTAHKTGSRVFAKFHVACGASPTLNVNNTGASEIRYVADTALVAGDIPINSTLPLSFDGTYWVIESTKPSTAGLASVTITDVGQAAVTIGTTESTTKFGTTAITQNLAVWIQQLGQRINGILTSLGNKIETSTNINVTAGTTESTAKFATTEISQNIVIWLQQIAQKINGILSTKFTLPSGGTNLQYINGQGALATLPTALPNPQTLTFTGGATGTYNGSAALSIEIPTNVAPTDIALTAETNLTGIDITTPAVASNTIANIVQTIWEKIRQVGNYILKGGKAPITTTGSATAYVLADTGVTAANKTGSRVYVKFHIESGNNPTLNVNNTGASQIRYTSNYALSLAAIPINTTLSLSFDGSYWIIESPFNVIVDNLNSTSATYSLSANQGNVIDKKFKAIPITTVTAATTLISTHAGQLIVCNNTANIAITVPAYTGIEVGHKIFIQRINTGTVTVTAGASQTVNRPADQALTCVRYGLVGLVYISANTWSCFGDLEML